MKLHSLRRKKLTHKIQGRMGILICMQVLNRKLLNVFRFHYRSRSRFRWDISFDCVKELPPRAHYRVWYNSGIGLLALFFCIVVLFYWTVPFFQDFSTALLFFEHTSDIIVHFFFNELFPPLLARTWPRKKRLMAPEVLDNFPLFLNFLLHEIWHWFCSFTICDCIATNKAQNQQQNSNSSSTVAKK